MRAGACLCGRSLRQTIAWHVVIAGTLLQLLMDQDVIQSDDPSADPDGSNRIVRGLRNRQFFVLVTSLCVLWPLVTIPTFHKLRRFSSLSLFAMLFVALMVLLRAAEAANTPNPGRVPAGRPTRLPCIRGANCLAGSGVCHVNPVRDGVCYPDEDAGGGGELPCTEPGGGVVDCYTLLSQEACLGAEGLWSQRPEGGCYAPANPEGPAVPCHTIPDTSTCNDPQTGGVWTERCWDDAESRCA
jgi:hypothetical protein